ncbi:MAG: hypothetical protein GY787_10605 [Alteromonadales bacterium]|nr:hypothetical protein [Alteromonadales bacterium]
MWGAKMKLECEKLPVTLRTVCELMNKPLCEVVQMIKDNKVGYFFIDGFKINIIKKFKPKGYYIKEPPKVLRTKYIVYPYIWDGQTMLRDKNLKEMAAIMGKSSYLLRKSHLGNNGVFVSDNLVFSMVDPRGNEDLVRLKGYDGKRYYFGTLKEIINNMGITASYSKVRTDLDKKGKFKSNNIVLTRRMK